MRDRHQPRRPIHRATEIVTLTQLRHTRMNPHPHPQRFTHRPLLRGQRDLRIDRSTHRPVRGHEHRMNPVTCSFDHLAVMLRDRFSQNRVVASQRFSHRVGLSFPKPRRHLKIRKQERHRAGRQRNHRPLPGPSQLAVNQAKPTTSSQLR
jgi:hypothetical protein